MLGPALQLRHGDDLRGITCVSTEASGLHGSAEFRSQATGLLRAMLFYRYGDATRATLWDAQGRIESQQSSDRQGYPVQFGHPWMWGEEDQVGS
ncbi:MAG: hypothetical protein AAF488_02265 [Planctomycetota bacterium]